MNIDAGRTASWGEGFGTRKSVEFDVARICLCDVCEHLLIMHHDL
jgi:hypothetical protein